MTVGGQLEHVPYGTHAEAIAEAMSSPFGVGNALFRFSGRDGYVDTLAFGAYRNECLEEVGLVDEELVRNQDDELNLRLHRAGHRIWLSKRIRSRYDARSTYGNVFRQSYQSGYLRVIVNRKHGVVTTTRQLIPPSFVLGLGSVALATVVFPEAAGLLLAIVVAYVACPVQSAEDHACGRSDTNRRCPRPRAGES